MLLADFVKVKICHQSIGLTVGTVWGVQIFLVDYSWTLTVNPFSSPLIKSRVMVSLSHVFIRQEAGYTLVRSPVHHKANRQKQTPIHFQIYTFSQLRITSWLSMHVFGHAIRSWSIQRTPSGQTPHRKPPPQKKEQQKEKEPSFSSLLSFLWLMGPLSRSGENPVSIATTTSALLNDRPPPLLHICMSQQALYCLTSDKCVCDVLKWGAASDVLWTKK